jgi:hypothetical protein
MIWMLTATPAGAWMPPADPADGAMAPISQAATPAPCSS